MNSSLLANNWALVLAAVPLLIAIISVSRRLLNRTATGQLSQVLADYRKAQSELAAAKKTSRKAAARVSKLASKAGETKPRILQEAREAAEDAASLEKIADDRAQVAANHVRRIIHTEFPPKQQEKLRNRYLPQDAADGRPYTF